MATEHHWETRVPNDGGLPTAKLEYRFTEGSSQIDCRELYADGTTSNWYKMTPDATGWTYHDVRHFIEKQMRERIVKAWIEIATLGAGL